MYAFYEFLCIFGRQCVLTAHNCHRFDYPRLLRAIKKVLMFQHYRSVVKGFCDTLPLLKKYNTLKNRNNNAIKDTNTVKKCNFTNVKKSNTVKKNKTVENFSERIDKVNLQKNVKGQNKLEIIAKSLGMDTNEAHEAIWDVTMLEQVLLKTCISNSDLINSTLLTWSDIDNKADFDRKLPSALKKLKDLNKCTSLQTRKKIVAADISYEMIAEAYNDDILNGIKSLLGKDRNGFG